MENYIKEPTTLEPGSGDNMGKKVLIATLYSSEPVLLATTRLGPDRLILLIDKTLDKEQDNAVRIIQDSLGKVMEVKIVKTDVYDIVEVAKECVKIIDLQPKDDLIYVNVTSGRKTKAMGLLFGAYARVSRVKKIAYNPDEKDSSPIYLPKLYFQLTESQKRVLEYLEAGNFTTLMELSEKVDSSRAMLYRNIKELEEMGLVEDLKLTDAGKIARL